MRGTFFRRGIECAALVVASLLGLSGAGPARERETTAAEINLKAGRAGCAVDVDSRAAGKTDRQGNLVLRDVDPSDHYLHVRCPGETNEMGYLVSPRAGETLDLHVQASPPLEANRTPLEAAEVRLQLRHDVQQAVRLRAQGRLEEAVALLREATKIDPENSDLHRELGISFLMAKEWKRARVEMLEAIRHDPSDADAHNGLGYSLDKLGDLEGALNEYRTASHLEPDDRSYREHYFEALGKLAAKKAQPNK